MAKTNDTFKLIAGLLVFCLASALGRVAHIKMKEVRANKVHSEAYRVKEIDFNFEHKDKKINITTTNQATNKQQKYEVDVSESSKKFNPTVRSLSEEQKIYQKQNDKLISQASKAYGFIISNDYKLVKYCAKYHPVTNLKKKFDSRFQDKKIKAENILNKAFGISGAKEFTKSITTNSSVLNVFNQQVENDFQEMKKLLAMDGIYNFDRKMYCQAMDEDADFYVEAEYENFKTILPNF